MLTVLNVLSSMWTRQGCGALRGCICTATHFSNSEVLGVKNIPQCLTHFRYRYITDTPHQRDIMKHVQKSRIFHPETLKFVAIQNEGDSLEGGGESTPEKARRELAASIPVCNGFVDFDGRINEIHSPAPTLADGTPMTVYVPRDCHGNPAILVYFHGGGMVIGSRASVDTTCRRIAMETPCIVVSVEYRLAPEHKFPASFEDTEASVKWVLENKTLVGGSSASKVGVGGDSAGATLSATVCHEVPGLAFQVLVYPRVEYKGTTERPSAKEYEDGPILSKDAVSWYRGQFLRSPADKDHVLLNPYLRPGFDKLPPALLVVAECDPLRDESYDYQRKMRDAGVRAELLQVDGACHSFFTKPGVFKECCAVAYKRVTDFIREFNTADAGK